MTIRRSGGRGKWRKVTRHDPCPACCKRDWCCVSADGAVAMCMRQQVGSYDTGTTADGATYYLHRLNGARHVDPLPAPSATAPERADADTLHRVYSAMLASLRLTAAHREALRHRGLSDAEIDRRGYRTLPVRGRAAVARDLRDRHGDSVLRVPGIVVRDGDKTPYVTIAGAAGILIPVRDLAGRIVALKVRRDGDGDAPRYTYISSASDGGPGSGAPAHVPLGVKSPVEVCRLTEGEIKADVATVLDLPTISAPGAANWRPALEVLRSLGCRTVRLAYDMDALTNEAVARALVECAKTLTAEAYAVEVERWDATHKGIDEALAAGATIELLTGDAALAAVREIAATIKTDPPVPILDRLRAAIAAGVEVLFRDQALLRDLARLAEDDPAEYAVCRAVAKTGRVGLRDLDRALAPYRQEIAAARPPVDAAGQYRISGGRIVRDQPLREGSVEVPLCTWSARIVEQVIRDDGSERHTVLALEGALADGRPLSRAEVAAEDYPYMRWPVAQWGTRAVVLAGQGTADHLRCAIQLLSGDVPTRTVYTHLGWREVGGRWYYLHAVGAIGLDGAAAGIDVAAPDALARYELPAPPTGDDLHRAVCASLDMLDLAADRITVPVLAAVVRAVLGDVDHAIHLCGPTGVLKTELAALAQQHYGAGLDARHLPGSWSSTGNSLEAIAHAAKDAILVVDDFAPGGASGDVQRYHRDADRLLRAQGNRSGRGRCRADGTVRAGKAPRGLVLSTGEDIPRGHSLRSRLFVVEVERGDVDLDRLTACQRDAAAGLYAQSLAGYLRWLAPQYAEVRGRLRRERDELRDQALAAGKGTHARTPGIVADLMLGLRYYLAYAVEVGAITASERDRLDARAWAALGEAAAAQAAHHADAEPCGHYLRLLGDALASGRAHLATPGGGRPQECPEAWGWRATPVTTRDGPETRWDAQGSRIGWIDGTDLYLLPEASFAEAQELARHQGEALPVQPRTLWRRMRERGLLATWDVSRQRCTIRRRLEGQDRREVIHLLADTLTDRAAPSPPSPPTAAQHQGEVPAGDGSGDGPANRPNYRPQIPSPTRLNYLHPEQSGDGGDGGDGPPSIHTGQESRNGRRRGTL